MSIGTKLWPSSGSVNGSPQFGQRVSMRSVTRGSERRLKPIGPNLLAQIVLYEHDSTDDPSDRTIRHAEHVVHPFGKSGPGGGRKGASVGAGGDDSTSGSSSPELVHGRA